MSRTLNRRLDRLERQEKATVAVRERRASRGLEWLRQAARDHAATVVGIILHGNPQMIEPLRFARGRMLKELGIDRLAPAAIPYVLQEVVVEKLPGATENEKFANVLRSAPQWLLAFCSCRNDAVILGFELPTFSDPSPEPGLEGINDVFCWPDLPEGTLGAGGPFPEPDLSALSPEELIDRAELREKGEENWSRHERRRHREMTAKLMRSQNLAKDQS